MPSGVQIIGASGTTQLDESYQCMFLVNSGVGGNPNASSVSAPLCAIRSSTLATTFGGVSGGAITYNAVPAGCPWYVFDVLPPSVGLSNVGLQVFDAAGRCTFDSGRRVMNIVDFFGGTIETAWIGTRTYAAGRTYAVIQAKTAWSFVEINSTASGGRFRHRETYQHSGSIVSGNQITTNWYTASATDITDDDPGTVLGTQTHKAPEAYFLVVDVT